MERPPAPLTLLAAAVLALAGCSPVAGPDTSRTAAASSGATTPAPVTENDPLALESAYERVISAVLPSIVQINTSTGLGSGVIYDTSGHIVTNAHVVGRATDFQVTLATGGAPRRARLVESFPLGDLAVIKVDDPSGLRPATFGDSGKLRVGQIVLAMGNPLGLGSSVTNGIVSALGRTVTEPAEAGSPGATITGAIQTSAAINPGNSGGALVDLSGRVIGIPTLAATVPELGGGAAPGIGFAIPSNTATDIAGQIVKTGRVTNTRRAALGVTVQTVAGPDGRPAGVGVVGVTRGGGAEKAGVEPGDVIVSVDGTRVPTTQALSELLASLDPGGQATVELLRPDGSTTTVTVPLGELPTNPSG
ncbi:S1C family serine protease [Planomonospora venezuelensis]|uniref:S1-C subfamily serine protease n=1 Tax=Planomonospora venezuelensis TaxID=1999 RepID=A0A841D0I5_PLAVE|nr:trypsin-like peptidase domain-containing protein [Planomonospora venezuelensis]MBB5962034.1 S1-C subfamily serine protease [Planomonospora venezuelensis]GIN00134.1 protease [Planomonospora venezuelensis]